MRNAAENRKSMIPVLIAGLMVSMGFLLILASVQGGVNNTLVSADLGTEYEQLNDVEIDAFIENGGQWDDDIQFAAKTSFGHVALGDGYLLYDVRGEESIGSVFRIDMVSSNDVIPKGIDPLEGRTNMLFGKDGENWGTNLISYKQIVYEDIWDGIDLVYISNGDRLKYEYHVNPGADPDDIRFRIEGSESIMVQNGVLEMVSTNGISLNDGGLISFYREDPQINILSEFTRNEDDTFGYNVDEWDDTQTMVIDPFIYSTYIGGAMQEYDINMDRDENGNVYLVGSTDSFDFQTTPGAYCTRLNRDMDGWVMKLNSDGTGPVFSTFIGGDSYDALIDVKVDTRGDIYVGGMTRSKDFPTTRGAFNETLYGDYLDLIAFKMDPTGSRLSYSTYIGGNGTDDFYESSMIQLDEKGCLYITGQSMSSNYPVTKDAYDKYNNVTSGGQEERDFIPPSGSKVVLTKLNPTGTALEYSTFLGDTGNDVSCGISLDDGGNVFIIGTTTSQGFPVTKGAYKTTFNSWMSRFITKLDTVNSRLVYSTFFGTDGWEMLTDVTHDSHGRVIVTGGTASMNFPVSDDAYCRENKGFMDVYVTALDKAGSSIAFSTLIGGEKEEFGLSVCLDESDNIYITGSTQSKDYPKVIGNKTPEQEYDSDILITVFNQTCAEMIYSTVVGGGMGQWSPYDEGQAIIPSGDKEVIVAGSTSCSDFPVTDNATSTKIGGNSDVVFFRFDLCRFPERPEEIDIVQGDGFLNITWEEPEDDGGRPIIGYSIFRGQMESIIEPFAEVTDNLFYNDTDIDIGQTYYYFIRAISEIGEGAPSTIVHSLAISAPTPPQFFQVQPSNGWVKITWETPVFNGAVSIQGYRLDRFDQTNGTSIVRDISVVDLDYYDSEVVNGHNYTYSATAWNRIGESLPSKELWAIPKGESTTPLELSVQNGPDFALLTWSPPEDDGGDPILFYRVYQGTMIGDEIVWRYMESQGTSFNDTLVKIGSRYLYYVTAVNTKGESGPSSTVEASPQASPSSPVNIKVSEGNGYVTLTWESPTFLGGLDLTGYNIYRSEGDLEMLMIVSVDHSTLIHKDRDVVNGVTYTYKMTALNSYGESIFSGIVQGTPASVPSEATTLTLEAGNGEISISWDRPTNDGGSSIQNFVIKRKSGDGPYENIGTVPAGTTSYTDPGVEAGVTYTYVVIARNSMGASPDSEEKIVTALGPPDVPTDIEIVAGDGSVSISWGAPLFDGGSPITGYAVYKSDFYLDNLIILSELGPDETSFIDDSVVNGEQYIYRVTAVNVMGESPSNWSEAIQPLGTPGAPSSIVLRKEDSDILISWSAPTDNGGCCVEFYRIFRTSEDGSVEQIGIVESTHSSYVDDSDKEKGTYTYAVVAVNDVGDGETGVQDIIEVSGTKDSGNVFSDNIGLFVTLPIILILLAIIVLVQIRMRKSGKTPEPTPVPEPVDQYPDMAGYFNGYPEQEQIGTSGQPPQLNNVQDYEQ